MTTPLITWGCIAGIFLTAIIVKLFRLLHRTLSHSIHTTPSHHLIEMGTESEEFFIPGDPNPLTTDFDCDYEAYDPDL